MASTKNNTTIEVQRFVVAACMRKISTGFISADVNVQLKMVMHVLVEALDSFRTVPPGLY